MKEKNYKLKKYSSIKYDTFYYGNYNTNAILTLFISENSSSLDASISYRASSSLN